MSRGPSRKPSCPQWPKRLAIGLLAGGLFLQATQAAAAKAGASAVGTSAATIVSPVSIMSVRDMHFGHVAVSARQDGTVVIDPESRSASFEGSARPACAPQGQCAAHPALFVIHGQADRDYSVAVPDRVFATGTRSAIGRLEVTGIRTASLNRPGIDGAGTLSRDGRDELRVGGELVVPAGSPAGSYVAEVRIVVSYD